MKQGRPKNDKEAMIIFASNLNALMQESNTSNATLARVANVNRSQITRYLNADSMPKQATLDLIAAYFKTSVENLTRRFTLEKNEAICLVDIFNGIAYSPGISRKDHLLINVQYCVRMDHHGKKHNVGDDFLEKLGRLSDEEADELVTKIHSFWGNDKNGMPFADQPYQIEDTDRRLKEVGLIQ